MSTSIVVSFVLYRVFTVLCGLVFAFLGFRLFCLGISEEAGELKATYGDKGLLLRQLAPGIYFALFGTIIVGASVLRGVDFSTEGSVAGINPPGIPPAGTANTTGNSITGELLGIDASIDLDNLPRRLLTIIQKLQTDGGDALDNQEKELLGIWMGKLKARVTASESGVES